MGRGFRGIRRFTSAGVASGLALPNAGNPTLESFPAASIAAGTNFTNPSSPTGTISAPYKADTLTISGAVTKTGVDSVYFQLNKLVGGASGSMTLTGQTEGTIKLLIEANEIAITSGFRLTAWTPSHNPGEIYLLTRKGSGLSLVTTFAGQFFFYEINYNRTLGMVFQNSGSSNMDFDNTVVPTQVVITGIDDLSDSSTLIFDISTDLLSTATMSVVEVGGSASDLLKSHLHNLQVGGLDPSTLYNVTITVFGTGGTIASTSFEAFTPAAEGDPAPSIVGESADLGSPSVIHVNTDYSADAAYCSLYTQTGDYLGDFSSSSPGGTAFDISLDGFDTGDFTAYLSASNAAGTGPQTQYDFSL